MGNVIGKRGFKVDSPSSAGSSVDESETNSINKAKWQAFITLFYGSQCKKSPRSLTPHHVTLRL